MGLLSFLDVRGIMVNPQAGLVLKFHMNPTELSIDKPVNYSETDIPGLASPEIIWVGGGGKTISFELFFDAREAGFGLSQTARSLTGVLGFESIIEGFLYPQDLDLDSLDLDFSNISFDSLKDNINKLFYKNKYLSPPDVYFIYGPRWWKCKLLSAPFTESAFDNLLTPQHLRVTVTLRIIEDGTFKVRQDEIRRGLSLAEGAFSAIEMPLDLVL